MKVFLDTNIIIDFYDQRADFFQPAETIMSLAEKKEINIIVSATTIINAFYILRKRLSIDDLYEEFGNLSQLCTISPADEKIIKESLRLRRKDFEDSVQYESAMSVNADVIVTRNKKDFENLGANVMTPIEFLNDFFAKKTK
ncbi:MAG: PIN domain-containing protein [Bacteroidales bacterium]|nr:PIN domain-containing protein [Bacteroidales bacterium]